MKTDWLWDRNIVPSELECILKDENHERFTEIAALLLSRKNSPREVFESYLDKKIFIQNWTAIKRQMRRNSWNDPRISFWQAVYGQVVKIFKEEGVLVRLREQKSPASEICVAAGQKLKKLREDNALTQKGMSEKLGISQQIISRIERGRDNVSLATLQKFSKAFGKEVIIDFI